MLVDDLDGGVARMRWRALYSGQQWLPKENLEELKQYAARVNRSDLYPGLSQGLDDAIARPFAKPVEIQNLPAELEALTQDIDGDGSDLTQFLAHFLRAAVKHGLAHAWVDYTKATPANGSTVTRADEMAANPRPWWRIIEAPRLLNWKSMTLPSGKRVLSEATIHEVRDGQEFVRILRLDSYELHVNEAYKPPRHGAGEDLEARYYPWQHDRRQDWKLAESGPYGPEGGFKNGLPIVTLYTGYRGFMQAKPPFLALAETNLTHWQSSSDQRNIVHVARVPILFARGIKSEELKGSGIGAGSVMSASNPGADLRYVEHSGAAVAVGQEDLDRLERRMEQLGVRPHVERMQGATATGVAINADGADTDVQAWAQAGDTAAVQCFEKSAEWMGKPDLAKDVKVKIFKDYQVAYKTSQDLTVLQADVDKGRIRHETYLQALVRRDVLPADLDIEAEIEAADKRAEAAVEMVAMTEPQAGDEPQGDEPVAEPDKPINEELKQTSLNGAQVTALQGMIEAVAAKTLPAEAAEILILEAFPALDPAKVRRLVALASKVKTGGKPGD